MRSKKRKPDPQTGLKFTGDATVFMAKLEADARLQQRKALFEFVLSILISMASGILVLLAGAFLAFSDRLRIPNQYVYLVATVFSSTASILIIFLSVRFIYRERKRERVKLIKEVRLEEGELFANLQVDFDRLVHSKEPNG